MFAWVDAVYRMVKNMVLTEDKESRGKRKDFPFNLPVEAVEDVKQMEMFIELQTVLPQYHKFRGDFNSLPFICHKNIYRFFLIEFFRITISNDLLNFASKYLFFPNHSCINL